MHLFENENFQEKLIVAGLSYRNTALEMRNRFSFTIDQLNQIYNDHQGIYPGDFFILSTCNRTEIYSVTSDPRRLAKYLLLCLDAGEAELSGHLYIKTGDDALQHLFTVASGLDSQIIGDHEITGQLKSAFALAKKYGCTSGLMEKQVNTALSASRQVKNNTRISDGTTSISYAVIEVLKGQALDWTSSQICLMGSGKIGALTLKNLREYFPGCRIFLVGRNEPVALPLANEYGAVYVAPENQREVIRNAEVLIVATGAGQALIKESDVENSNVKLIFDLSVPANVSDSVRALDNIQVYDIDSLSEIINRTLTKRKLQIPVALEIIKEHIIEFRNWESRRMQYSGAKEPVVLN